MDFITYPLLLNADTMPHGAFVKLILLHLDVIGITDPVFMYSKNTAKPPNGEQSCISFFSTKYLIPKLVVVVITLILALLQRP